MCLFNVEKGLSRGRTEWVLERGHVEEYEGRDTKPEDNGGATGRFLAREFPVQHRPLRGDGSGPVTQYEYDALRLAKALAQTSPLSSHRNLSAMKSPEAARSSRLTSTMQSLNRKSSGGISSSKLMLISVTLRWPLLSKKKSKKWSGPHVGARIM